MQKKLVVGGQGAGYSDTVDPFLLPGNGAEILRMLMFSLLNLGECTRESKLCRSGSVVVLLSGPFLFLDFPKKETLLRARLRPHPTHGELHLQRRN
jgi:hypothetical protein